MPSGSALLSSEGRRNGKDASHRSNASFQVQLRGLSQVRFFAEKAEVKEG